MASRAVPLLAGLLAIVAAAVVLTREGTGFVPAVHAARWTARVMLPFFVAAFVALGRRFEARRGLRQAACRGAAAAHAAHLVTVAFVVSLEPPSSHEGYELLTEVGGATASAVVLAGWRLWDRGWYRWTTYWPWAVFAFTYLFLPRLEDSAARVVAAPAVFGPVLALLAAALLARVWGDLTGSRAGGTIGPAEGRGAA